MTYLQSVLIISLGNANESLAVYSLIDNGDKRYTIGNDTFVYLSLTI